MAVPKASGTPDCAAAVDKSCIGTVLNGTEAAGKLQGWDSQIFGFSFEIGLKIRFVL